MADATFWGSEEMRDRLKIMAVKMKKTIRELTDEAIEKFLKENGG